MTLEELKNHPDVIYIRPESEGWRVVEMRDGTTFYCENQHKLLDIRFPQARDVHCGWSVITFWKGEELFNPNEEELTETGFLGFGDVNDGWACAEKSPDVFTTFKPSANKSAGTFQDIAPFVIKGKVRVKDENGWTLFFPEINRTLKARFEESDFSEVEARLIEKESLSKGLFKSLIPATKNQPCLKPLNKGTSLEKTLTK